MVKKLLLFLSTLILLSSCSGKNQNNVIDGKNFDLTVTSREDGSGTKKVLLNKLDW